MARFQPVEAGRHPKGRSAAAHGATVAVRPIGARAMFCEAAPQSNAIAFGEPEHPFLPPIPAKELTHAGVDGSRRESRQTSHFIGQWRVAEAAFCSESEPRLRRSDLHPVRQEGRIVVMV